LELAREQAILGNYERAADLYRALPELIHSVRIKRELAHVLLAGSKQGEGIRILSVIGLAKRDWYAIQMGIGKCVEADPRDLISEVRLRFLALHFGVDSDDHYEMGICLKELGRYDEALTHAKQSVLLEPTCEGYSLIGNLHRRNGELESAIIHYRLALQLNPNFEIVLNNLGLTFIDLERYGEAVECLDRAHFLYPDDALITVNLFNALLECCRYDECHQMLREYPFLVGAPEISFLNIARVHYHTGHRKEADQFFEMAKEDDALIADTIVMYKLLSEP